MDIVELRLTENDVLAIIFALSTTSSYCGAEFMGSNPTVSYDNLTEKIQEQYLSNYDQS